MKPLTLEQIAARLDAMQEQIAHAIRIMEERPERAYASLTDPMTVSARDAARILGVKRDVVYELHHDKRLNGFRPRPNAHLRFLVSEVRALASTMSSQRENA